MQQNAPDTDSTGVTGTKSSLAPKAQELLQDRNGSLPCWVRSPKYGTEFYSGFSRAKLYQLASEGKIRSVSIRDGNAARGTRLFNLPSILAYIEKCEAEANAASAVAESTP